MRNWRANNMNRNLTLAALVATALLGSLFAILGANMFFSDIGNIGAYGPVGMLTTMPALLFAALFPTLFLYLIRYYLRPKTFKRLSRLYVIIAMSLSFLGFLTAILSGVVVYGSFIKPYPFPGYLIVFMVLHAFVLGGGVFALIKLLKLPEDEERFRVNAKHIFKTLGWFLFISLAIERLGLFIASPLYIYWRNFYMTFPFYLFLLVPSFLGAVKVLTLLGYLESKKLRMILSIAGIGVTVALFVAIAIPGVLYTSYVSSVSTAMPMERLGSKPMEILIHLLSNLAVGIILLVQTLKDKKEMAE